MPTRLCLEPRCAGTARYRGRCPQHARTHERRTHSAEHKRIYNSKRWRITREKVLTENPLCSCGAIATDVDHVVPLEQGGDPWALSNLQALCGPCHASKTAQEIRNR